MFRPGALLRLRARSSREENRSIAIETMQDQGDRGLLSMAIMGTGRFGDPAFLLSPAGVPFTSVQGQIGFYWPGKVTTYLTTSARKAQARKITRSLFHQIVRMEQMERGARWLR